MTYQVKSEKSLGGAEKTLNKMGADGWKLESTVAAPVKGCFGDSMSIIMVFSK